MKRTFTRNLMIDLETFGRRPNGLVVSIGAVFFEVATSVEEEEIEVLNLAEIAPIMDSFHGVLSWEYSQTQTELDVNPDTMDWWQSDKQRSAFNSLSNEMRNSELDMKGLLQNFFGWFKSHRPTDVKVWANSPSFDLVILENAAKSVGIEYPINHRSENDYRTLTDLVYGVNEKPRPPVDIAHDALSDAKFQAMVCAWAILQIDHWKTLSAPSEFEYFAER